MHICDFKIFIADQEVVKGVFHHGVDVRQQVAGDVLQDVVADDLRQEVEEGDALEVVVDDLHREVEAGDALLFLLEVDGDHPHLMEAADDALHHWMMVLAYHL